MDLISAAGSLDSLTVGDAVDVAVLLVDVFDTGPSPELQPHLVDALHTLCQRVDHHGVAALIDWWGVCAAGRPSRGPAWDWLGELPESWVPTLEALRDLDVPAGPTALGWLSARRDLDSIVAKLGTHLRQHVSDIEPVRQVMADMTPPFRAICDDVESGRMPQVAEVSDRQFRASAGSHRLLEGSPKFRDVQRAVREMGSLAKDAVRLAGIVRAARVQAEVPPLAGPLSAEQPLLGLATAVLRGVLGDEPPSKADVAASMAAAAVATDDDGRKWAARVWRPWHIHTGLSVAALEGLWAEQTKLLDELRQLRLAEGDGDGIVLRELIEEGDSLDDARELLEQKKAEAAGRARETSVRDRLRLLRREVERLEPRPGVPLEELMGHLSYVEADVADGRLEEADEGIERLREAVTAAVRDAVLQQGRAILAALEEVGASFVAEARGELDEIDAGRSSAEWGVVDRLEERLKQARADRARRVGRLHESVTERYDATAERLDPSARGSADGLMANARAYLAAGNTPAAERALRQLGALLDEAVIPQWRASSGEADLLQHVVRYLGERASFDEGDILRFHVALKARKFVILAGLTGTGKSTIGRLYAEALDATTENGRFVRVAVRPNWVDGTEVLGYLHPLNNRFQPGILAGVIRTCLLQPDVPVFCVLDEMNLAPVEQYLADLLSAMEEARSTDRAVPVSLYPRAARADNADEWPHELAYPDNLFLIGTVNIDETTRPLSDRVMDRSNVIQLSVSHGDEHHGTAQRADEREPRWHVAMGDWDEICVETPDDTHHDFLSDLGRILAEMRIGLGTRAHLEIESFLANAAGVLDPVAALDLALLQRVLPKVKGFKGDLRGGLEQLAKELDAVGAARCARVVADWLDSALSDDAYLDGTSTRVGLASL